MNRLTTEKRTRVIAALVEGNSIRATVRMTGVAKNTISNLLLDVGAVSAAYQDRVLRDLPCERIQCDEIWSFVYSKQKNVPDEHRGEFGYGDVWTWTALCADTKLVPSWLVGQRDIDDATVFMQDLVSRLRNRVQLTTDGHHAYLRAVDASFKSGVDFAQLQKLYGSDRDEGRYSPPACIGEIVIPRRGDPDPMYISTSYVERVNLTMRMGCRRYTRLTNAFSKKVENLTAAVSLHFLHYNFVRVHQTLKTTPAVAAGVAEKPWKIDQIVDLLRADESN